MPKVMLLPLNAALMILRILRRLTQTELGELTGMLKKIVEIENGRKKISRGELERAAKVMEVAAAAVPVALGLAEAVLPSAEPPGPWEATAEDRLLAERAALEAASVVRQAFLAEGRALRWATDRAEAERLWQLLAPHAPERRRAMARVDEFCAWAVIERLCIESLKEAPRDPGTCRSLAELAVELARRLPPQPGFSDRMEGYAQAHLGNAFRVGNDFEEADCAFARVETSWIEVSPGEACPLDVTLILDLESSLRRDQRLFPLALDRINRALALAADDSTRGRILIKKALVLGHSGDPEEAVKTLLVAQPLVELGPDTRLPCVARFNLAVNLIQLERPAEAEPLVGEVREYAIEHRNDLDLLRVDWLSGRLAAAKGHHAKALTVIDDAARRFSGRKLGYDAALATLDLSALLLEEGNAREAARRVAEVRPAFQVRNIHREELASLVLFLRALEAEAATAALARAAAEAWRLFGAAVPPGIPAVAD